MILGNEDSTISGFHKTGREGVRPEAYPILKGGVAARSLILSHFIDLYTFYLALLHRERGGSRIPRPLGRG